MAEQSKQENMTLGRLVKGVIVETVLPQRHRTTEGVVVEGDHSVIYERTLNGQDLSQKRKGRVRCQKVPGVV